MHILSWNIQSARGYDGHIDIIRIADHIKSCGDFDVICLQEISRNMDEYCIQMQMDQREILSREFRDYDFVWGTGFSWPATDSVQNGNQEFGNLTLLKTPALDHKVHQLPMPATESKKQMPRVAVETIMASRLGPLSIINTHLAYHDDNERIQQIERLSLLESERKDQCRLPKLNDSGAYQTGPLPFARILCGDFNFGIDYADYQIQIDNDWLDAWATIHPAKPHHPTCGIFDHKQWPQGPHCRDYFWLSRELSPTKLSMHVDTKTDLSDHQPIMLEIDI